MKGSSWRWARFVVVLDADDEGDFAALAELGGGDVAEADVTDEEAFCWRSTRVEFGGRWSLRAGPRPSPMA